MKSLAPFCHLGLVILALLCPVVTKANILYEFDTPFPGDPSPAGTGPWIDASFVNVAPGAVLLTITNVNLTSSEFVMGNGNGANGGLFFNLNPNDNPSALDFTLVSSNGNFGPIISTGENDFKADGDGYYDVQFDFSGDFSTEAEIAYLITGITNLTAADFAYQSFEANNGESGPFYAAAKVQGIPGGGNSTFLEPGKGPITTPVPEPSPSILLAGGFSLFGVARLWLRRAQAKPFPRFGRLFR